jgi:uncharacterized protein
MSAGEGRVRAMRSERVTFPVEGVNVVGDLRVPADVEAGGGPGLVFSGPFSGVKEQVTGTYAERLCAAGFVTLAFDPRHWGESGGEPRQHEDVGSHMADLRAATSFLSGVDEVDPGRLGAVGICSGGGRIVRFAAFDPRIRTIALIAGGYNHPQTLSAALGDAYGHSLERLAAAAERQDRGGPVEYLPMVSADGDYEPVLTAADEAKAFFPPGEPYEYYGTARGATPGWVNQVTLLSAWDVLTTDYLSPADFIAPRPAVVVHGEVDAYLPPEGAQAVYERLGGPKEIVWLPATQHIELYDVDEYVNPAVEHTAEFLAKHLG